MSAHEDYSFLCYSEGISIYGCEKCQSGHRPRNINGRTYGTLQIISGSIPGLDVFHPVGFHA